MGISTRFVILAAPRTGSNWLCTLLDSHPEILCHHEIFNPEGIHYALSCRDGRLDLGGVRERDRDPRAVLRRLWEESFGHRAVGFKINRGQSPEVFRALFADRELKVLVIRRQNRIKTYVSEKLAEATGEWESYPGREIGRKRVRVEVDLKDLRRHIETNRRYFRGIEEALAASGQESLDITYEALGTAAQRRRILAFLAVDHEVPLAGKTRKQRSRDLRDLVVHFDALAEELGDSDLRAELESKEF